MSRARSTTPVLVVDLGEIGGHSHRIGARGRGHRGREEVAQIDGIDVGNRDVRRLAQLPLRQQDSRREQAVQAEPMARENAIRSCVSRSLSRHHAMGTRTGEAGLTSAAARRDGGRS